MPLVPAKCTQCGADVKVDSLMKYGSCEHCGTYFLIEEAIQNYNYHYHITNNINAEKVVVTGKGDAEKERLLKNAETYLGFKDYNKAYEIYRQVTEDYPDDYRGWYSIAAMYSNNFTNIDIFGNEYNYLSSLMNKALICASGEVNLLINQQWDDYNIKRSCLIEVQKEDIADLIKQQKARIDTLDKRRLESEKELSNCESKLHIYNAKLHTINSKLDSYKAMRLFGLTIFFILLVSTIGILKSSNPNISPALVWIDAIFVFIVIAWFIPRCIYLKIKERHFSNLMNNERAKNKKFAEDKVIIEREINKIRNEYDKEIREIRDRYGIQS